MSQVFSADSVSSNANVTVVTTAETPAITGNFLNVPFQNAKAVVFATLSINVGAGSTTIQLNIRRNPNAENLVVGGPFALFVTAATPVTLSVSAADKIPDGRSVQYQLTVIQGSATGNGTTTQQSISTLLISG